MPHSLMAMNMCSPCSLRLCSACQMLICQEGEYEYDPGHLIFHVIYHALSPPGSKVVLFPPLSLNRIQSSDARRTLDDCTHWSHVLPRSVRMNEKCATNRFYVFFFGLFSRSFPNTGRKNGSKPVNKQAAQSPHAATKTGKNTVKATRRETSNSIV